MNVFPKNSEAKRTELLNEYEALITKRNEPTADYNGIYQRFENPVLTD